MQCLTPYLRMAPLPLDPFFLGIAKEPISTLSVSSESEFPPAVIAPAEAHPAGNWNRLSSSELGWGREVCEGGFETCLDGRWMGRVCKRVGAYLSSLMLSKVSMSPAT